MVLSKRVESIEVKLISKTTHGQGRIKRSISIIEFRRGGGKFVQTTTARNNMFSGEALYRQNNVSVSPLHQG